MPKDPEIRSSFVSPFRTVFEGVIFIRKLLVVSWLEARSCVEWLLARGTEGGRVCTTGDDIPRRKTTSWWRAVASKFPCKPNYGSCSAEPDLLGSAFLKRMVWLGPRLRAALLVCGSPLPRRTSSSRSYESLAYLTNRWTPYNKN